MVTFPFEKRIEYLTALVSNQIENPNKKQILGEIKVNNQGINTNISKITKQLSFTYSQEEEWKSRCRTSDEDGSHPTGCPPLIAKPLSLSKK